MDKEDYSIQFSRAMKATGLKFTRNEAKKFIIAMTKTMAEGLARDRNLIVSNFGSFEVIKVGSKIINSPRGDKKKFFMPPTDIIKWHPSGKIRSRGESTEVSEEEFRALVGHAYFEPESVATTPPPAAPKRKNPYEVEVRIITKGKEYLSDKESPISRLVKLLINELKNSKAEKVEIRPGKEISEIIYIASSSPLPSRRIPKISHNIIIEKIKTMATADPTDPKLLILPLSETERILVRPTHSQFGEILALEMVK